MKIYDIEKDGLYDKSDKDLIGRTAFIFDGCVVSGWYLDNGNWEANSDVGIKGEFSGEWVKKYIVFDKPVWLL